MSNIQQASVKLFLTDSSGLDLDSFIPVFHEWIREKRLPDHLLIDVADYRHVPNGPGVMIIAHEAHYGIDSGNGEPGFLYTRKRDEIEVRRRKCPMHFAGPPSQLSIFRRRWISHSERTIWSCG